MAGPLRTMTTMNQYLADRKWLFHERGLMFVWNELKTLFGATVSGASVIGPADMVTNFNPDFVERGNATGQVNLTANGAIIDPPTQSL